MADHSKSQVQEVKLCNTAIQYSKHHKNRHYSALKMLKIISFKSQFLLSDLKVSFLYYFPFSGISSKLRFLSRKCLFLFFSDNIPNLSGSSRLEAVIHILCLVHYLFFLSNLQHKFCFLSAPIL